MNSRRNFLKKSSLIPFGLLGHHSLLRTNWQTFDSFKKSKPLLSFSTLGCPAWTFTKIIDFASLHNYNGIEIRGIKGQLDLTKCDEFATPVKITETKKMVDDKGLKIVDLGSSTELHHADKEKRKKNIDDGKKIIELAGQLGCPYIRVFPNSIPNTEKRDEVIALIIDGLNELGNFARSVNVMVLMETHGDAVKTNEIKRIMESCEQSGTGLVWDIVNMWSVTREPPSQVYRQLKKYIKHTHVKDCRFIDGRIHYVLFGTGEAPIYEGIDALYKGGYKGYYSFEWEKLWHPEIEDPEIALAAFPLEMKKHFSASGVL